VEATELETMHHAPGAAPGPHVAVEVTDTGSGMDPATMERIFDPFFTTKPAGEGTGLGLSMSHDIIVKQHGGSIEVETEAGQFTEFRIVLPRMSTASSRNRGQA
jgi:signal transduction histidine kinase